MANPRPRPTPELDVDVVGNDSKVSVAMGVDDLASSGLDSCTA